MRETKRGWMRTREGIETQNDNNRERNIQYQGQGQLSGYEQT